MKINLILLVLLICVSSLFAQKKQITEKDFARWNQIETRQISIDGKYVMYELNPLKGDGKLLIHNTITQKTDTLYRGCEARFIPGTEAIVYKIKVPEDTLRSHKLAKTKKENMPKDSLGIFRMTDSKQLLYSGLKSFSVSNEVNNKVAVLLEKKKREAAKSDTIQKSKSTKEHKGNGTEKERELFDLLIVDPVSQTSLTFPKVESYTVARKGNTIIAYSKLNDTTRINVLISINTLNMKADTLLKDSVTIKKITLDEKGKQLAYLGSNDTAKIKNYRLFYSPISSPRPIVIADSLSFIKSTGWSPSENGDIYFSQDGSKLFFGIAPKPHAEKNEKILDEEKPKLDVWSYNDKEIQPLQLKNAEKEKKKTYLTVYRTTDKKLFQLADSTLSSVRLLNRNNSETALGINRDPYLRAMVWDVDLPADYYHIDLKTGAKTKVLSQKENVWISPNGNFCLYFESGNYYALNNKTNKTANLSQNSNVSFVDELNDVPAPANIYGIMGWSENEAEVFIYDRYDIWKFDLLTNKPAINITNGRASKTNYRYLQTDHEEVFIPTNKPVLLSTVNEESNREGFSEITLNGQSTPITLIEGDYKLANLTKAKNKAAYIWSAQTVKDYPEVLFTDTKFAKQQTLSQANKQQTEYNWLSVEKVQWLSFAGDRLNGLLYKPEDFDPNGQYPMVVYYYERNSENIHLYKTPQPSRSTVNIPNYCSNGYLVFVPDITYKTGYPGQSAYKAIVSGVSNLLTTRKYINSKKIGLQGQSWGGYQTAYLITQTDMFAAAMAGAPVTNMTSAYGGIRWGTGNSRMFQYEKTQSRIGGTLWEKPLLYVENSPLFMAPKVNTPLLMMANDNDGAVPWYQGIEFFMALYRLNKPVWLLNYNGMEHNLEEKYWANRIDLNIRMMGFFDHYLKDKPAPAWMTKGIKATEKGETTGY